MAHTEEDWQRVASAINTRMEELGLSQTDLARAAGISRETVRKLQYAEQNAYQRRTLTAISEALWDNPHGIHRVLRGQEPVEKAPDRTEAGRLAERLAQLDEEQRQRVLGYIDAILDQGL